MTEDVEGRIRELKREKRFWKRCALGAGGVLVLALVAFTSLSLVLYTSLMAEKDRLTQQLQDFRKTAVDGLQQGKELLRGLNLDGRKIEQQVRQFLKREPSAAQPHTPPPAAPAAKDCPKTPEAPPTAPVEKDCRQAPEALPLPPPAAADQDLNKTMEEGLRRGKEFLRGLKLDRKKVEKQVRQLLEPEPSNEPGTALPTSAVPAEKH
jgi:hypothetical protein